MGHSGIYYCINQSIEWKFDEEESTTPCALLSFLNGKNNHPGKATRRGERSINILWINFDVLVVVLTLILFSFEYKSVFLAPSVDKESAESSIYEYTQAEGKRKLKGTWRGCEENGKLRRYLELKSVYECVFLSSHSQRKTIEPWSVDTFQERISHAMVKARKNVRI